MSTDLTGLIPPDARVTLVVGPDADSIGPSHRLRNPCAFLVASDEQSAASTIRPDHVDRRLIGPSASDQALFASLAPGSVDCLVFGPALEDIPSIRDTLIEVSRLVAPQGVLLATSRMGLEAARRWAAAIDRAGFTLIDVEPWLPGQIPFDHHAPTTPRSLAAPPDDLVLLRAAKGPSSLRRLLIQTLAATPICARVRTEEPAAALRTIPGVRTRTDTTSAPLLDGPAEEGRVFIRQRNILGPGDLAAQRALRRAGYLIVAEWDDDPTIFPEIAAANHLTFRACHCIQTSTEPLAETLRAFNPHVRVFRNQLAALPPLPDRPTDSPVTLFFGALNREADWPSLVPSLRGLLEEHPDRVRVEVVHDRAFFDSLPPGSASFRPLLPHDQYLEVLRGCDIALLPLTPTRFNRCKSDLKYLECAANGVVCLASPTVYADTIRHEATGMIFRSAAEFDAQLRRLVADPSLRARLRLGAYRDIARNRLLCSTFRGRYDWYQQMCERLPDLDRELCDRVPELA